ncbi:cytosine permease [Pseudomonas veronii]|uniref:purine-cytosine permease family protein n=1 Tax=Pseudomonas veronii TaxID=76761 RepID=UPI0021BFFB6A|nr:cytosine permease [Pseudomonas veronii]MCT8965225.1 cytosine permease [Pseudomonas veronii]
MNNNKTAPPPHIDSGALGIEKSGIDYVPLSQRHGKAWHLAPVWFSGTAHLLTFAVGFVGPAVGLNLVWTLIASVLGLSLGIFFSAFHSTQGPQLGLPQMVQSRPQFGYYGAVLIFAVVVLVYVVQGVSTVLVSGPSLTATTGLSGNMALIITVLVGVATAVIGYKFIHRLGRWVTYAFLVVFAVLTVEVLFRVELPAGSFSLSGFSWTPFLLQFGVCAGYLIGWAPFVSDVSRYLPPSVGVRRSFWWTAGGMWLGAAWLIGLGAVLAIAYPAIASTGDIVGTVMAAGDAGFNGLGKLAAFTAVPGLLYFTGVCFYSASLTLCSIADTFGMLRRPAARIGFVGVIGAGTLAVSLLAGDNLIEQLGILLPFVLSILAPWTAINLVDFYVVRRGRYSVREIFNPSGIYGRWSWRGLLAYVSGMVVMIPFISTTVWQGPIAEMLGGADISPFIGLPVAGVLYLLLSRSLNLDEERALIVQMDKDIDRDVDEGQAVGGQTTYAH